jgi:hypothetical protein
MVHLETSHNRFNTTTSRFISLWSLIRKQIRPKRRRLLGLDSHFRAGNLPRKKPPPVTSQDRFSLPLEPNLSSAAAIPFGGIEAASLGSDQVNPLISE